MSDDEEWTYGVDEVGPEADEQSEGEAEPGVGLVSGPIEPGNPKAEHVLFFVLGVLAALGAFYAFLF